jgi:hypothetical protein
VEPFVPATPAPQSEPVRQIVGFLVGLALGVGIGLVALSLVTRFAPDIHHPVGRVLIGGIGLVQFVWIVPLAFVGWKRRNVGLIVGLLFGSLPLMLLDLVCLGPAALLSQ